MSGYLKTFRVRLKTVGPVFVGNGKEITKKEYILQNQNKRAGIIDISRMYQLLKKKGLSAKFEDFLMNDPRSDLRHWLQDNQLSIREIESCIKYYLDNADTVLNHGTKIQIMECIKDPYGNPYIPGSSMKGMFRTVLLGAEVINHPDHYDADKINILNQANQKTGRKAYLAREIKQLESNTFCTLNREGTKPLDAVNDNLSGLIVSDSDPLSISDLILCQKVERYVDGTEKRLNLLRECIRPGTEIALNLTIDPTRCSYSVDMIQNAVRVFSDSYYKNFLDAFHGICKPAKDCVYLGGGSGYVSKTVTYPLLGKEDGLNTTIQVFEKTGVPIQHKHYKDRRLRASPHIVKCTHYQGKTLQMGQCHIVEIVEFV